MNKKTICLSCGTSYDHAKNDGLCPMCSAYNSADNTKEVFEGATKGVTPVKLVFENPTSASQPVGMPPPAQIPNAPPPQYAAAQKSIVPVWIPVMFFCFAIVIILATFTVSAFKSVTFEEKNKSENVEVIKLSDIDDVQGKKNYIEVQNFKVEHLTTTHPDFEGYIPLTVEISSFTNEYNTESTMPKYEFFLKCDDGYTIDETTDSTRMLVEGLNDESSFSLFYTDKSSIKLLFFIPEKQFDSYTLCATQYEYDSYKYAQLVTKIIEIPLGEPVQEAE